MATITKLATGSAGSNHTLLTANQVDTGIKSISILPIATGGDINLGIRKAGSSTVMYFIYNLTIDRYQTYVITDPGLLGYDTSLYDLILTSDDTTNHVIINTL